MATATKLATKKLPAERIGPWRGGFIRRDSSGELTYYIDEQIVGRRFTISTHCHTEDDANDHYKRFRKDPVAYAQTPRRTLSTVEPVVLDEKLAARFLDWSEKERRNSTAWVACQRQQLAWWAERWGNTNL